MARTAITINEVPPNGGALNQISWTAADAANGMEFVNDGDTELLVKNGHTAAQTVTVVSVADPYGRTLDTDIVVPAGEEGSAGPFLQAIWNQAGSKVFVDIADDTALEVAAMRRSRTR